MCVILHYYLLHLYLLYLTSLLLLLLMELIVEFEFSYLTLLSDFVVSLICHYSLSELLLAIKLQVIIIIISSIKITSSSTVILVPHFIRLFSETKFDKILYTIYGCCGHGEYFRVLFLSEPKRKKFLKNLM